MTKICIFNICDAWLTKLTCYLSINSKLTLFCIRFWNIGVIFSDVVFWFSKLKIKIQAILKLFFPTFSSRFFYVSVISDFFIKRNCSYSLWKLYIKNYVNIITEGTHLRFSVNYSSVVTVVYRAFNINVNLNLRVFVNFSFL